MCMSTIDPAQRNKADSLTHVRFTVRVIHLMSAPTYNTTGRTVAGKANICLLY